MNQENSGKPKFEEGKSFDDWSNDAVRKQEQESIYGSQSSADLFSDEDDLFPACMSSLVATTSNNFLSPYLVTPHDPGGNSYTGDTSSEPVSDQEHPQGELESVVVPEITLSMKGQLLPSHYLEGCKFTCERCGTPKLAIYKASDLERPTGFQRWDEVEVVLLTAAVMRRYFRYHSLSPTKAEKKEASQRNETSDKLVWRKIREDFLEYSKRRYVLTGKSLPNRSPEAMQKQWKLSEAKKLDNEKSTGLCNTEKDYWDWVQKYNGCNILSCPQEDFEQRVAKFNSNARHCCKRTRNY